LADIVELRETTKLLNDAAIEVYKLIAGANIVSPLHSQIATETGH
jgi:hypothetical protein